MQDAVDHEHPREVFLAGCSQIAEALKPEGFRFKKSGTVTWRAQSDWRFEVYFQSSWHNIAGEYVCLIVHAAVRNKSIVAWEKRVGWPLEGSDILAGGQMGNVQRPYKWLEFNIADPNTRDAVLAGIVTQVRHIILPFFARFDEPQELAKELLRSPDLLPLGVEPSTLQVLRFVFWQLGAGAAEQLLSSVLNQLPHPEGLKRFRMRRDHANEKEAFQHGEAPSWTFPAWLVEELGNIARSTRIGSGL